MRHLFVLALLTLFSVHSAADTTITYQGQLRDGGEPFSGTIPAANISFEIFDDPDLGNSISGPINPPEDVDVSNGFLQVDLDFGDVHDGGGWLQIAIEGEELTPRQRISAAPLAVRALNSIWTQTGTAIEYSANNQGIWFIPDANSSSAPRIILGHASNEASAEGATVSGGGTNSNSNIASGSYSTIGGGADQQASGNASTIAGGGDNRAMAYAATVAGGTNNEAQESAATVAGGDNNDVLGEYSSIGGGWLNLIQGGDYSVISGGGPSDPDDRFNTRNIVFDNYGVISGGGNNKAGTDDGDTTNAQFATIGGGKDNSASARGTTISGGIENDALADRATVGGGAHNIASEELSTVGGGVGNQASGLVSVIGGGFGNTVSGSYATVAGGMLNEAEGNFSLAAGRRAKIQDTHHGTFLWADSTNEDFFSTSDDQFRVRASGGAEFDTGTTGLKAFSNSDTTTGAAIQAESANPSGIALVGRNKSDDATLALNNTGLGPLIRAFSGNTLLLELENSGDMTIDGNLTENSDRHAKESIRPVDNQQILQRLADLDITTWRYKDSHGEARHIGPMAQDFHALFGFGQSNTTITGMDVRGVALAAIQALRTNMNAERDRNDRLEQRLDGLEARNARLRAENDELNQRLAALEALVIEDQQIANQ